MGPYSRPLHHNTSSTGVHLRKPFSPKKHLNVHLSFWTASLALICRTITRPRLDVQLISLSQTNCLSPPLFFRHAPNQPSSQGMEFKQCQHGSWVSTLFRESVKAVVDKHDRVDRLSACGPGCAHTRSAVRRACLVPNGAFSNLSHLSGTMAAIFAPRPRAAELVHQLTSVPSLSRPAEGKKKLTSRHNNDLCRTWARSQN